jgi:flagellar motor switch protein FliM
MVQNLLSSSSLSKNIKIKIYRAIILPIVLYGCETWSLTLREERRLTVFENSLLRNISEPMRNEVTEKWKRLYSEELYALYSSPSHSVNQIKNNETGEGGGVM